MSINGFSSLPQKDFDLKWIFSSMEIKISDFHGLKFTGFGLAFQAVNLKIEIHRN
jgi:hypothetical protein